jgi:hypothetical protein
MITPKLKKCAGCGEDKSIWKNYLGEKFCKDCWYKKEPISHPKQKTPLKGKSDKRNVLDQLYSKLRKEFLIKNPYCQAKLQGCSAIATDVHHKKGRGSYYLDQNTWIGLCRACHQWITDHNSDAIKMGLSVSRLNNNLED